MNNTVFAPGARISSRGEDFLITGITENFDGSILLDAEGISELVKGKRFKFDTKLEKDIQILDPANTKLVADTDFGYRRTKLFLETQLRNNTHYGSKIHVAHKAAFNLSDYQLDPTLKAFKLPRPRLLIADGVGLGKTIEVGIFLAEMIKRGKGKRIMVLALKSILGQFQQEIWNRFAIPLVRLDSHGIAQIRTELPANKNPFEYYDKTIISIDTLKNNAKFRHYIEKSRWDIIVIDECHTVANSNSQRGDLAQFLATRCESLVLTSATPHNGKKETFANLIQMIEPTAIPRTGDYDKSDVAPYYVRRFKQHILDDQVRSNFQERQIIPIHCPITLEEEVFLSKQQKIKFEALQTLDLETEKNLFDDSTRKEKRDLLFSIGLFKAYMSSPLAADQSISRRIERIRESGKTSNNAEDNISLLKELKTDLELIIKNKRDSKYQTFKEKLIDLGWSGRPKDERIVVFAERIDTLAYLRENLMEDFDLGDDTLKTFHGGLTDIEQQALVEDFGKKDSQIRILLTSDAGSQGVNLHFFCHLMFNYDIPWSLITLEQRNGRIDRYGQTQTPKIHYLVAKSDTEGLKTDFHILENLTKKEEEVYKSLGDVASVFKLYDSKAEETKVEEAIIQQNEDFFGFSIPDISDEDLFGGEDDITESFVEPEPIAAELSLYANDGDYYRELIEQLKAEKLMGYDDAEFVDPTYLEIKNTKELDRVLFDLPKESKPEVKEGIYRLSLDKTTVQNSIAEARKKKGDWAKFQMLYDLHPVIRFLMTKLEASVDKEVALVARHGKIPTGTAWFVIHGQASNNLGQSVISDFFVVPMKLSGGLHKQPVPLQDFIRQFDINKTLLTQQIESEDLETLSEMLIDVVDFATSMHMDQKQQIKQIEMEKELAVYQEKLKNWEKSAKEQFQIAFADRPITGFIKRRMEDEERYVETIMSKSSQYYKDLNSLNNEAHLKVIAVFYN
ncbi:DEAD/DEAH box helicase [Algoriphagus sp. H41]|uniref:DEAD/DEAH box helicase n=1 Tax=Algoriphagus oliviformis TaxID=2811231 RepID=A0ABS3C3Q6_9BACT|nr:helicase-related protein [Algoriphagus oliviformis]MBN7811500.1 DEAD/DEAH box helicase [Algoriphagus oliviformis]